MRNEVNPEKFESRQHHLFKHRVIVPVYIPNLTDFYYQDSLKILKLVITQLVDTINVDQTAITIINNDSCKGVTDFLRSVSLIDKYVEYQTNKGKVLPILNEVRGITEPYVTLMDADVILYHGWEKRVFDIFSTIPKAGVVAPLPCQSLAFYHNQSAFVDLYLSNNLRCSKVVDDDDSNSFIQGLGNTALHRRSNRSFDWNQKQYHFKNDKSVVLGSGHFVATYKTMIFKNDPSFPKEVFRNGLEERFIDQKSAELGLYRLSTTQTFAYHMGNVFEDIEIPSRKPNSFEIPIVKPIDRSWKTKLLNGSKVFLFRILKRLHQW